MPVILRAGYEEPTSLKPDIRIFIDVFRASTTVLAILEGGADSLLIANDLELIKEYSANGYLVVSEVFDLGIDNSPTLIRSRDIRSAKIILKTSNLTTALEKNSSGKILIASFNNLSAIFEFLNSGDYPNIEIVPAGNMSKMRMNVEDLHCANVLKTSLEMNRLVSPDRNLLASRIEDILKTAGTSARPPHYRDDLQMAIQPNISALVPKVKMKTSSLFEVGI